MSITNTSPRRSPLIDPEDGMESVAIIPALSLPKSVCSVAETFVGTSADESFVEGAMLLLSVASIVSKEMNSEGIDWEDDIPSIHMAVSEDDPSNSNESNSMVSPQVEPPERTQVYPLRGVMTTTDQSSTHWRRLRTVSMDEQQAATSPKRSSPRVSSPSLVATRVVSPSNSPVSRGRPIRKAAARAVKRKAGAIPTLPSSNNNNNKRRLQPNVVVKGNNIKTILRKKFSWKNYPELEEFLIANREEYLRHSALNYTVQQKQYNNKLTERLLELAGELGYVFDEGSFSFVTVRDRIRCYFKSYVQSAKKRGVIIGYAARKAGLLSEHDLEGPSGRIVVPKH